MNHSDHSTLTLTHPINEYHVNIPWNSVLSCGFCSTTLVAKYLAYDVLFNKCYAAMHVVLSFYAWYVFVRSRCRHQCIPRSVVAVILTPSVIVLSTTDPPCLPSSRSSLMIGASGKPWTTTTMDRPRRVSRTSTASRRLLCARRPCSSPFSLLSSSSSQNALPKVGGGRPPKSREHTPLLPRWCCHHPPSRRRCRCCPPNPPAQ